MTKKEKVLMNAIHYFQGLVKDSKMKNQLIEQSKTKTIEIYEEISRHFPPNKVKEIVNISEQKIFKLKTSGCCNSSLSRNCLKLNPNQLSLYEQQVIKALLENKQLEHLPLNYLHSFAERQGLLIMSQKTFYKYAKKLNIKRCKNENRHQIEFFSPKANSPFQILHMDSTYWYCNNGERVYIHFIQDNFSKKILGGVVSFSSKSKSVVRNLKKVIEKYHLQERTLELYCDDGPENKKEVDSFLSKNNFKITKVIANYKTKKSNNSIEAWNKTFKRIVLKKFRIDSFKSMEEKLPEMLDYFNNLYLPSLNSLTPNEVASGKTRKDLKIQIKIKKNLLKRLEDNRNTCCFLKETDDYTTYDCLSVIYKNK